MKPTHQKVERRSKEWMDELINTGMQMTYTAPVRHKSSEALALAAELLSFFCEYLGGQ